jgi:hypothetical protein
VELSTTRVLGIGAAVGALDGVGIFFAPGEPYPVEIFLAAVVKGMLVALLVGSALRPGTAWVRAAGIGVLYGFLFALVVFLAKGGMQSMAAPYVVPSGVIFGGAMGVLIAKFGARKAVTGTG